MEMMVSNLKCLSDDILVNGRVEQECVVSYLVLELFYLVTERELSLVSKRKLKKKASQILTDCFQHCSL